MEAVILDFYGTLARAVSRGPLAAELFARRGLPFHQPTWDHHRWDVLDGLDHQEFSGSREDYEAWEVDRLRRAAQACGVELDQAEELVAELYAASKDFTVSPYEEVAQVLEELRRRGLVLGVCSNWDWDLDLVLDEAGLTASPDLPACTRSRRGQSRRGGVRGRLVGGGRRGGQVGRHRPGARVAGAVRPAAARGRGPAHPRPAGTPRPRLTAPLCASGIQCMLMHHDA